MKKILLIGIAILLIIIGGISVGCGSTPARTVEVSMTELEKMLKAEGFDNWLLNYGVAPEEFKWGISLEEEVKLTGGTLIITYSPDKFISFLRSASMPCNINVYLKKSSHKIEKTYVTDIGDSFHEPVILVYKGIYEYTEEGISFKITAYNFYKVVFSSK